jgi:hypothetical protein
LKGQTGLPIISSMTRFVALALAVLTHACNPVNPQVARVDGALYSDDPIVDGGVPSDADAGLRDGTSD